MIVIHSLESFAFSATSTDFGDGSFQLSPEAYVSQIEATHFSDGYRTRLRSNVSFAFKASFSNTLFFPGWKPRVEFGSRMTRFKTSEGQTLSSDSVITSQLGAGVETMILESWNAMGVAGVSEELFLQKGGNGVLSLDRVRSPYLELSTSIGVYEFKGIAFSIIAKGRVIAPVKTRDYSTRLGYSYRPTLSGKHSFSPHFTLQADAYGQKRTQDTSFSKQEQIDLGLVLTGAWEW